MHHFHLFGGKRIGETLVSLILTGVMIQPVHSQKNLSARQSLENRHAQIILLHYLDGYLCLTPDQYKPIVECLNEEWPMQRNRSIGNLIFNGPDSNDIAILTKRAESFEKILTKSQMAVFDELDELTIQLTDLVFPENDPTREEHKDSAYAPLKSGAHVQIDSLTKSLNLSEKQRARLKIAAKGAIQSILESKNSLLDQAQNNRRLLWSTNENLRILMEGPVFQLEQSPIWQNSLRRALTPKQFDELEQQRLARSKLAIQSAVYSLVIGAQHGRMYLSAEELGELVEFMLSELQKKVLEEQKSGKHFGHFEVVENYFDFPAEELQEILTKKNWRELEGKIDAVRQRRAEVEENAESGDNLGKDNDTNTNPKNGASESGSLSTQYTVALVNVTNSIPSQDSRPDALSPRLESQFQDEETVDAGQKRKSFEEKAKQFSDHCAQAQLLYLLDGYLCLTRDQQDSILEVFEKDWRSSWNIRTSYTALNGIHTFGPTVLAARIKSMRPSLTEAQWSVLKEIDQFALKLSNQIPPADFEKDPDYVDSFEETLKVVAQLQIDQLHRVANLTKPQRNQLQVAAKGAVKSVLKTRRELFSAANGHPNLLWSSPQHLRAVMESPAHQIGRTTIWKKSLQRVLEDEQCQKTQVTHSLREKLAIKSAAFAFVHSFQGSKSKFTSEEHLNLMEMLIAECNRFAQEENDTVFPLGQFEADAFFLDIPNEKYSSILSKDNWEVLSQYLEAKRKRMREADETLELDDSLDE